MRGTRAKYFRRIIRYNQRDDREENTSDSRLYGPHRGIETTVECRSKRNLYQHLKTQYKRRIAGWEK